MVTEKTLAKFGLIKDKNNLQLKEILKNDLKLREVHIDIYPDNPLITSSEPFMLLSRIIEKNAIVLSNEDRIVLKKNDKYGTYFINILFSKITECHYKFSGNCHEFILSIQNIYYRMIIFN